MCALLQVLGDHFQYLVDDSIRPRGLSILEAVQTLIKYIGVTYSVVQPWALLKLIGAGLYGELISCIWPFPWVASVGICWQVFSGLIPRWGFVLFLEVVFNDAKHLRWCVCDVAGALVLQCWVGECRGFLENLSVGNFGFPVNEPLHVGPCLSSALLVVV